MCPDQLVFSETIGVGIYSSLGNMLQTRQEKTVKLASPFCLYLNI